MPSRTAWIARSSAPARSCSCQSTEERCLIGGHLGDRYGLVRTVQIGNALLVPSIAALLLCRDPHLALLFALLTGTVTSLPFAVLIKLGQDYLPTRPGTASGVTLGLAVSAGGLLMPVLGALADHAGTQNRDPGVVRRAADRLALVLWVVSSVLVMRRRQAGRFDGRRAGRACRRASAW
jgi:MFS family permease